MNVPLSMQRMSNEDRLRNICRHWRKVVQPDTSARVPTTFALLLDAAAQALEDEDNRYAEAKIRADQLDRSHGQQDENSEREMARMRGRSW